MNTRQILVSFALLVCATNCEGAGPVAVGPPTVASTAIAFSTWSKQENQQISVLQADGTTMRLTRGPVWNQPMGWSPDGSRLLVFRHKWIAVGEYGRYVVVTPNGSQEVRLAYAPIWPPGEVAWSPDGTLIAIQDTSNTGYGSIHDPNTIYLVRADNTGTLPSIHAVRDADYPNEDACCSGPLGGATFSWSPDSLQLAIVAGQGRQSTIELVNVNDGRRKVLLQPHHGMSVFGNVAWSPDGSRIAFTVVGPKPDTSTIFTIQADGTNITRLGVGVVPQWSPDGSRIAFQNATTIRVVYADGTGVVHIPKSCAEIVSGTPCSFTWSPDGSQIALSGEPGGPNTHGIWVANTDGTRITRLPTPPEAYDPLWQPAPAAISGLQANG